MQIVGPDISKIVALMTEDLEAPEMGSDDNRQDYYNHMLRILIIHPFQELLGKGEYLL
jgi:hypothetical protein